MRTIRVRQDSKGKYFAELSSESSKEPITTACYDSEEEALEHGRELAEALKTVNDYVLAALSSRQ